MPVGGIGAGGGGGGGGPNPGATPELDSLILFGGGLSSLGAYALMPFARPSPMTWRERSVPLNEHPRATTGRLSRLSPLDSAA